MKYHDNEAALWAWDRESAEERSWGRWMVRRLRDTLLRDYLARPWDPTYRLSVTSDGVGKEVLDVLVRVDVSDLDRVYHFCAQSVEWAVGGFCSEDKPVWMRPCEWFLLCTVADSRTVQSQDAWEQGAMPFRGTGFMGLCEFDVERAARQFLLSKGLKTDPEYVGNDPVLG